MIIKAAYLQSEHTELAKEPENGLVQMSLLFWYNYEVRDNKIDLKIIVTYILTDMYDGTQSELVSAASVYELETDGKLSVTEFYALVRDAVNRFNEMLERVKGDDFLSYEAICPSKEEMREELEGMIAKFGQELEAE